MYWPSTLYRKTSINDLLIWHLRFSLRADIVHLINLHIIIIIIELILMCLCFQCNCACITRWASEDVVAAVLEEEVVEVEILASFFSFLVVDF